MNFHSILSTAGSVLALALFVPMIINVRRDGGAGQSFATWLLWAALDTTLTITIYQQHGNFLIFTGFALGGIGMSIALISRGRFSWGWFETAVAFLVLGCELIWKTAGPRMATIAATAAVCVAGIPGLVALWKNPDRKTGRLWWGYVLANGLAFLGGTAMTVEERMFPGVFTILSALMVVAAYRRPPFSKAGDAAAATLESR